jgi:hypothetical protein
MKFKQYIHSKELGYFEYVLRDILKSKPQVFIGFPSKGTGSLT